MRMILLLNHLSTIYQRIYPSTDLSINGFIHRRIYQQICQAASAAF
jgi:hypothetical protein